MFDQIKDGLQDMFIKHDPKMLNNIYGSQAVTPYWVADMEFPVANAITEELRRLVDRGIYAYEFNSRGVLEALVAWYGKRNNLSLNADSFIQVPGVLTGISLLLQALTEPEEGVLIQVPAYHQFDNVISRVNRKVVRNPLVINNGKYEIDFNDLEKKLCSENIKVMLLCNPHNPTGRVWTVDELQRLVDIAEKHQVYIISDEIHSDIVYSGHHFNSIVSLAYDKSIALLGSPAKTFGMHSISNGYIYTENQAVFSKVDALASAMYLDHGNALSTFATIAAYEKGEQWVDDLLTYLEATVGWIEDFIKEELPQVRMFKPEGTYQIWFDFSGLGLNDEELKSLVFHKAGMGLTPGSWFGAGSDQFLRMNIASPLARIQDSFERLGIEVNRHLSAS
ncbi:aspartate aminotransferase [Endozoicomonas elysicola]|uniref:cysteine-S-conjugate beta-lyase n=2 Tax=Endozoicomonas elysicola TaxID=305900 RepID=A0A081K5T4_9GAMM|nr:aspartate aminotransferase [Endozoicomonas elysicola]